MPLTRVSLLQHVGTRSRCAAPPRRASDPQSTRLRAPASPLALTPAAAALRRAGGRHNMKVQVRLGVPPEAGGVDLEAVRAVFPYGCAPRICGGDGIGRSRLLR